MPGECRELPSWVREGLLSGTSWHAPWRNKVLAQWEEPASAELRRQV